jgi:hypothetical protein
MSSFTQVSTDDELSRFWVPSIVWFAGLLLTGYCIDALKKIQDKKGNWASFINFLAFIGILAQAGSAGFFSTSYVFYNVKYDVDNMWVVFFEIFKWICVIYLPYVLHKTLSK